MGEVYRARDTKLGRDVAVKILPASLTSDSGRLARFSREAQVLAALNHPNIAAIYHVEEMGDGPALVMELVEGETLADRIARGPIPVDEALPIAKQIAEALEAAHEQGIIHRDLKPANIKVRVDGTVKVLDFGLAKLTESNAALAGVPNALSMSPTITSPALMSGVGILLGTAAYMSPEQAKGKPADKRSDIWAFGCVLYEMLTAKRAFEGEDVSDTLAAVLRGEPDWAALSGDVPSGIRKLVTRCLQRDRRNRIADLSTALFLIEDAATPPTLDAAVTTVTAPPRAPVWKRAIPLLAAAAMAGGIVGAAAWILKPSLAAPIVARFMFTLPEDQRFTNAGRQVVAMSPDGTRMVYAANQKQQKR
jgi:serine/threonine-protein kinase